MLALLLAVSVGFAQERSPMGVNFRFRAMTVPDSIIDTWYFTEAEGALQERPHIGANVYGLEYTVEPAPSVYTFYIEYMSAKMDEGYWDDKEDPPQHTDGDWIQPEGLGAVVLGANYGHELVLTDTSNDVWLGLMVGGGLGVGFATGHMNQWKPGQSDATDPSRCLPGATSIERKDECDPDDTPGIWPVIPVVDISGSLRVHITEYAIARLDLGVHDMLYIGGAAGGVF